MSDEVSLLKPSETDRCAALIREFATANQLEIVRWVPLLTLDGQRYGGWDDNCWMAVAHRGGRDFVLLRVLPRPDLEMGRVYAEESKTALRLLRESAGAYATAANIHREAFELVGRHGMLADSYDTNYQGDYYNWILTVKQGIYERRFDGLQWEMIADEWGSLASRERDRLEDRLTDLFLSLLEQGEPKSSCLCRDDHTYERAAREARHDIQEILADSPSLAPYVPRELLSAWRRARHAVLMLRYDADEECVRDALPEKCPWSFAQVMDDGFWPATG